jgi:capsular polysaccharide export protein
VVPRVRCDNPRVKIAYLDPPYSRYFHALAGRLAQATQGASVALLSSPAYRLYTAGDRCIVWQPGVSEAPHAPPADYVRSGWLAGDERSAAVFAHAVEWFKARFVEEGIECCLVFSDVRPFSLAAQAAARELGVVCLYFERGAFRFITSSLSTQGLNSRFSLRRGQAELALPEPLATYSMRKRPAEPWLRLRFAWFMARNALACALQPDRGRIQHKRYALMPYVRLAVAQWWTRHHDAQADVKDLALASDRPLVVVPLQLASDSQLVLHSPFDSNQAFIDFVSDRVRAVCPQAELVFKRHPMDTRLYRLPAGGRWFGGNIARLYDHEPIVVCVNSTVGFEALIHGVRVLCFGPSFYTEAAQLLAATPEDFGERFAEALALHGDQDAGRALRAAILRCYQAPGDVWSFTDDDIQHTTALVLDHVGAARAAHTQLRPVAGDPASASAGAMRAGATGRPAAWPTTSSEVRTAHARPW